MNSGRQKKIGVILTYFTQILKIIIGLVYTPVMLALTRKSEYGLYQIADSVISYLSLINLGVLGAYARYYTLALQKGKHKIDEVNGVFFVVLFIMSIICVLAGSVMVCNVELLFGSGFTEEEYQLSKKLMIFLIVNMSITFQAGLFEHNITVNECFITVKLLNLLKTVLNPFIALPLLLMGYGAIGLVFTTTFLTIVVTVLEVIFCVSKLNMRFRIDSGSFVMLKDIGGFTFFIFLNQIIDLINWNIDKILIGRFIGSVAVAVYSVGGQLRQMFSSFPNAIRSVFQPQMYKMVALGESDQRISNLFTKVGRIQCLVLLPILFGFICIGKQFINLWTGHEYKEAYYVAICIMIPATIPHMQDIGIDLQRARKKHQVRSVVYAFIAVINVLLTIPLVRTYGIIGASFATGLSLLFGQGIFMNFYYAKVLHIDIRDYWKKILWIIGPESFIAVIFYIFCHAIRINSWWMLILMALIYIFVYACTLFFWYLTEEEKKMVLDVCGKLFRKCKR